MKPLYVPILKAKQGEFDALAHLSERASNQIIPWFNIPQLSDKNREKLKKCSKPPIQSFLNDIAFNIAKAWSGRPLLGEKKSIFMDLPQWSPDAQIENGEHIIPYLLNQLERLEVNVNPVVRYDFWDDPVYVNALKNINLENERNYCIRLDMDSDTVDEIMSDSGYVNQILLDIVQQLELNPTETYLLIDFGDVSKQSHSILEMIDEAKQAISLVQQCGFSQIMLAGASLPTSINEAVEDKDATGIVLRKEMMTWQILLSENPSLNIIFADYGVRNPNSVEESKGSKYTNGKIRYTTGDKNYFIARGHWLYISDDKFHQFCDLAKTVITSEYYLGEFFSWADKQLSLHSNPKSKPGGLQEWITIDTNHHIETVVMEILEFNRQLVTIRARNNNAKMR